MSTSKNLAPRAIHPLSQFAGQRFDILYCDRGLTPWHMHMEGIEICRQLAHTLPAPNKALYFNLLFPKVQVDQDAADVEKVRGGTYFKSVTLSAGDLAR